jgi:uncharacterized protein with ParB-like and HNH nuclease domain
MRSGNYSLKDLLTHNEIDQFIIPELQRDYVWKLTQVSNLWNSILKKYREKEESTQNYRLKILNGDIEIEESKEIADYLKNKLDFIKYKQKLGFLYAYHDKEWPGKFFLIDGQQRITTLFLLLLALYKNGNRLGDFSKKYFKNNLPIIDYKVRESAYEFLRIFLADTIAGDDYKNNINYFIQDYKADETVQNLQENFDFFDRELKHYESSIDSLMDYIENYIEFNYFDTNLSEQGEKLYLYMNSRGFRLSHQEILRAKLIEKCHSKDEKRACAILWEDLQNYFFENKEQHPDADIGFEIFLNIATLLKKFEINPGISFDEDEDKDSQIAKSYLDDLAITENNKGFQITNFDLSFLSKAFESLKAVLNVNIATDKYQEIFVKDFFTLKIDLIDKKVEDRNKLFRYIPALYYYLRFHEHKEYDSYLLDKFVNFAVNISHTRGVANKPAERILHSIDFINRMEHPDLSRNKHIVEKSFHTHEAEKLSWLEFPDDYIGIYATLSNIYYDYNFQALLEGETDILFDLADKYCGNRHNYTVLFQIIEVLRRLFFINDEGEYLGKDFLPNKSSNLLRRYLLTYFDYKVQSGTSYDLHKYNLIHDPRQWINRIFRHEEFKNVIKNWLDNNITSLLDSFENRKEIIVIKDYRHYFIQYEEILNHTTKSMFLWNENSENIILMRGVSKSSEDIYLACKLFLIASENNKYRFKQHLLNICYTDLVIDNDVLINTFSNNSLSLAIDLHYSSEGKWKASIFYREESSEWLREKLSIQCDFIKWTNDDNTICESRFTNSNFDFNHETSKLNLETEELYDHVESVIIKELNDLKLFLSQ